MARVAHFLERQALRLEARWSHWSLDERLAAGFDPSSDPVLAMRAEQLCAPRHRRRLADWLERLAHDSEVAWPGMSAAVPIVRGQVSEARDSLRRLADLLRNAGRVRPRGVAMIERLLTDADTAIYTRTARVAVELQVQAALRALEVQADRAEEEREEAAPVAGMAEPATTLPL